MTSIRVLVYCMVTILTSLSYCEQYIVHIGRYTYYSKTVIAPPCSGSSILSPLMPLLSLSSSRNV
jgi:hypothetical protein